MSFRRLGKLFKSSKADDEDAAKKCNTLPTEGLNTSIQMLLAYSGRLEAVNGLVTREVLVEESPYSTRRGVAALRRLGRGRALGGADPFEDLEIDKIVDVFIDLLNMIQALGAEQLDSRASPLDQQVALALASLAKLDAVVATNRGHLALSKLTWADFLVAGTWGHVRRALRVPGDRFANIELLARQLAAVPANRSALEQAQAAS